MKKYAFAGASWRGLEMFMRPMYNEFKDCCELVGVYDVNPGRSKYVSGVCGNMPVYDDFDTMVRESGADCVIVTTVDAYHSDYIVRAMELGCDVITEKPMTIDAERCAAILDAEKKYGKKVNVTFNYRMMPYATKIKELLATGVIGKVYSVHFEWLLTNNLVQYDGHGESYFRRWNSRMAMSGGLLVHKSTHHFDLINWWLGNVVPDSVSAFGALNMYGRKNSPFKDPGHDCRHCTHTKECKYYYNLVDFEKKFYAENEQYDTYGHDGCPYADDIDIYDTMVVNVKYKTGELLSYQLNATSPYEGYRVSFNGSKGRMEVFAPDGGFEAMEMHGPSIKVFDEFGNRTIYNVASAPGGHGGGDPVIRERLFRGGVPDPWGQEAGTEAGRNSIMVGAAANTSIKEGRIVTIDEELEKYSEKI